MSAERVDDPDRLAEIADDWRALYGRCPAASPFQSPDWLLPWWAAFRPGRLAVTTIRRGGRLVAIAPCHLDEASARLLPLGTAVSDDTDVLVDPDEPEADADLAEAVAAVGGWTSWAMEDLLDGAAFLRLPMPAGSAEARGPQSARPCLALAGGRDGDGLPLAIPADRRRKIRRARRLLAEAGGGAIERDPPPDRFLDALVRLHGARWTSRGEDGVLAEAPVVAFHRAALPKLTAVGLARTALLWMDGEPAAAYYGLARDGAALAYLGGFDPGRAAVSPGALLIADAILRAVGEGDGRFDFLRGREAYKYAWGAVDRWTTRREFRRPA